MNLLRNMLTAVLVMAFCTSPALAKDSIKVAAFLELSRPASFIGTPAKQAVQMVIDKINKEGWVNGQSIELMVGDIEGDPSR